MTPCPSPPARRRGRPGDVVRKRNRVVGVGGSGREAAEVDVDRPATVCADKADRASSAGRVATQAAGPTQMAMPAPVGRQALWALGVSSRQPSPMVDSAGEVDPSASSGRSPRTRRVRPGSRLIMPSSRATPCPSNEPGVFQHAPPVQDHGQTGRLIRQASQPSGPPGGAMASKQDTSMARILNVQAAEMLDIQPPSN
jgi:hypothetical protein